MLDESETVNMAVINNYAFENKRIITLPKGLKNTFIHGPKIEFSFHKIK